MQSHYTSHYSILVAENNSFIVALTTNSLIDLFGHLRGLNQTNFNGHFSLILSKIRHYSMDRVKIKPNFAN